MKRCPYCVKTLPFFAIVFQRLTFEKDKSLVCPNCKSIISSQGSASIWFSVSCGGSCGLLLGNIIGSLDATTIAYVSGVSFVVFIISLYFTASIRNSE